MFGFALGDHGVFCRREAFVDAGGYPDVPLMEDAELYRALRRLGRMRQLHTHIVASPRRFEQLGRWRTTLYYGLILALYVAGARIDMLTAIYRQLNRSGGAIFPRAHSASRARLASSSEILSRSTTVPSGVRQ